MGQIWLVIKCDRDIILMNILKQSGKSPIKSSEVRLDNVDVCCPLPICQRRSNNIGLKKGV